MNILRLILLLMLSLSGFGQTAFHLTIKDSRTRRIIPAMMCITNLGNGHTYMPPGIITPAPTFPDTFYTGFSLPLKYGAGPIRKMSGPGAVNGQRTYVYGNAISVPYWPEPILYQVSGQINIRLFPGRYRISIEHGNEYRPVFDTIKINGGINRYSKEYQLWRWIDLPRMGWYSGDVHTHHPMNTRGKRDFMMQMAEAEDLHLVNVLEMGDRQRVYFPPKGYGANGRTQKGTIVLVTGQEEPRSAYGHIIGLNTDTLARDTSDYDHYDIVFNKIHRNPAALVGFAHFAYGGEGVKPGLAMYAPTGAIDFVELMQNTAIDTANYYAYLNLGFHLTAAYGSDFPWGSTIGDGRVFVYTGKEFSADKWFASLKAGRSFVSNGPAVFLEADGQIPGANIVKEKDAVSEIVVKAYSDRSIGIIDHVVLMGSDGLLKDQDNLSGADSVVVTLKKVISKSQWVTAAVYCRNGALAHTSPVYFIVDGRSTYNLQKGPFIIDRLIRMLEEARPQDDAGVRDRIDAAIRFYRRLKEGD